MNYRQYHYRKKSKINYGRLAVFILCAAVICFGVIGAGYGAVVLVRGMFDTKTVSGEAASSENDTVKKEYVELGDDVINSPYGVVYDVENTEFTAGRGRDVKIYPASMTKVMTLVVAVERLESMDKKFTISEDIIAFADDGNYVTAGFLAGETVTADDLLHGLIMQSGADCAQGIVRMVSGGNDPFAKLMNDKAAELGLKNTHFVNALGAHDEQQYSTVEDMTVLFDYAMKNETCAKILSCTDYTSTATWAHPEGLVMDNHAFTNFMSDTADIKDMADISITAVKAGFTDEAGRCLITYGEKNGRHFITVTAKASTSREAAVDACTLLKKYTD